MKHSYQLIAKFNYNEKMYFILLVDKNKIIYAIYKDKKLIMDLSKEDLAIFYFVHSSLKIETKRSIRLGKKKINRKEFDIFYDPKVKLHYWYEIKNNEIYETTREDNNKLSFRFNNMPTIYYESSKALGSRIENKNDLKNKKSNFITRLLKVNKKFLVVLVSTGVALTSISGCSIANHNTKQQEELNQTEEKIYQDIEEIEKEWREYNYYEIQEAIENNPNLTDSEKEIWNNLKFVFDENHEYMDLNIIIERLSTLKIEYVASETTDGIVGTYNITKNEITIYNATNLETSELSTIIHEFLHVLQTYPSNRLTVELSNELTTREALRRLDEMGLVKNREEFSNELGMYSNYGNGYQPCMIVEYWMANLITQEEMKEYQFYPREEIIVNALVRIDRRASSNKTEEMIERAYQLLDSIDSLRIEDENEDKVKLECNGERYEDIYNQINHYYKKLNGKGMEESLRDNIFCYETKIRKLLYGFNIPSETEKQATGRILINTIDPELNQNYTTFGPSRYVLPKTYLSDTHPNPIIMFNSPSPMAIEVTEELDNIYNENYKEFLEEGRKLINNIER